MRHPKGNTILGALTILMLLILACNVSPVTPTAPAGEPVGEATPQPPSPTPASDVTAQTGCTLNGAFVA
ncbi:MAG TPA: hypothetical protein G4O00_12315, partial [Thermoflexia bacterium]|nr:hypothetical protein [Thermoflexia bacterium]